MLGCLELRESKNTYILFAGWEVRIVKNCDRGLENAARGRRPRTTKYSIETTYSDLHYNLKVNRGKLALINRPWKCKTGKDRRTPLVNSRKLG